MAADPNLAIVYQIGKPLQYEKEINGSRLGEM
jgi:hypothetical protein